MGRKSRAKAARREDRTRTAISRANPPDVDLPPQNQGSALDASSWLRFQPSRGSAPDVSSRTKAAATPSPVGWDPASEPEICQPDACERLRQLAAHAADAQRALEVEIRMLVSGGHSWTDVGRALGMTRQGARQRYRRLLHPEAPPSSELL